MTVPGWVEAALVAAVDAARQVGAAGVALVGSHARGTARTDSDLDLVLLVQEPDRLLKSSGWFSYFGEGTVLIRTEDFGGVQERRLLTADGHEIEICVGQPNWAAVDPVDPGTAAVVRDGFRALYDPTGLLSRLVDALNG